MEPKNQDLELKKLNKLINLKIKNGQFNKTPLWSWTFGLRSIEGGYRVKHLFSTKILWIGLIRYYKDHHQPIHTDGPKRHFKINIVLKRSIGGEFKAKNSYFSLLNDRILIFRADNNPHQVTPVISGERLVLSFSIFI